MSELSFNEVVHSFLFFADGSLTNLFEEAGLLFRLILPANPGWELLGSFQPKE
jgi:hypothetical protein